MNRPQRVQQRRAKGWRKPEGVVSVARGTRWGNPFRVGVDVQTNDEAVMRFRAYLVSNHGLVDAARRELRGKDLMCWCKLDDPCHADTWLMIANGE